MSIQRAFILVGGSSDEKHRVTMAADNKSSMWSEFNNGNNRAIVFYDKNDDEVGLDFDAVAQIIKDHNGQDIDVPQGALKGVDRARVEEDFGTITLTV